MGIGNIIVSWFLHIQIVCFSAQLTLLTSELVPTLSGSWIAIFIASDVQEASWASLVVCPVHIVSLVLVEVYLVYVAICTFKIKTYKHISSHFGKLLLLLFSRELKYNILKSSKAAHLGFFLWCNGVCYRSKRGVSWGNFHLRQAKV